MKRHIPYGRQSIDATDIQEVIAVLNSDFLTQGPAVENFERAVADYCGARYGVAVCNATAALHIACLALGLEKNQSLWTVPNTFVASANCARYCGANVDFVDIDPHTYNISIKSLEDKLKKAAVPPKIIVAVHFSGQSADMKRLYQLKQKYGFYLIEDASHAIGAQYDGRPVGSCEFSDMAVFSFHPVKIITTGEGGMVMTNQSHLADKLKLFRSHGITREPNQMEGIAEGPWSYAQIDLGYNFRLTDIQAALGMSQLKRIDSFVDKRRILAQRYEVRLKKLPLILPFQHPNVKSAFHLFVIRLKLEMIQKPRLQVFEELRSLGIGVNVHYIPVHTQPYYRRLGFRPGDYPEAEKYYREALSLPLYPDLSFEDQDFVIESLEKILNHA